MKFVHVSQQPLPVLKQENNSFTNKRHYITPDGQRYPSITTILGNETKQYLENWKALLGPQKAKKETERCAARGTSVHKMLELYLNNDSNVTQGHEHHNVALFNQMKFQLNKINNIWHQECALYSDTLKIAGTCDCICEYNNNLSIVDFKTSSKIKKPDQVNDYRLQVTAYSLMYYEQTGVLIDNYAILIAVEQSILPQVFVGTIKDHLTELHVKIDKFYHK